MGFSPCASGVYFYEGFSADKELFLIQVTHSFGCSRLSVPHFLRVRHTRWLAAGLLVVELGEDPVSILVILSLQVSFKEMLATVA